MFATDDALYPLAPEAMAIPRHEGDVVRPASRACMGSSSHCAAAAAEIGCRRFYAASNEIIFFPATTSTSK